ncbi:MAG TPA: DNA alkylation repair protein [Galbitalea sp.]|jgi:3-methyladenine DNA glycosylase AlkD|nr:DNA alkylation repair protein [Galbitalea sp.]
MEGTAAEVIAALASVADPEKVPGLSRFFKTGAGEYGEGDVFLGLTVPTTRRIMKPFTGLPLDQVNLLLDSGVHEHRFIALLILVVRYKTQPGEVANFYLAAVRRGRANNWDLVDCSAEFILGEYLFERPRDLLFELAASESIWERRVAMLSTFGFIKRGDATTALEIATILAPDRQDLIQKAVGWMLREVGKRVDPALLLSYLDAHAASLSRTSLSYATEHLTPEQRIHYRGLR